MIFIHAGIAATTIRLNHLIVYRTPELSSSTITNDNDRPNNSLDDAGFTYQQPLLA